MMPVKVNRNDPCPCGSGKIYIKCCGIQKTVSITSIIEKEVMDLQTQFIQYAMDGYDMDIDGDFSSKVNQLIIENENEMDFFIFVHMVWFSLFVPMDAGKTILQHFIEERSRITKRPQVKEILQSWTNPRPIAGRMLEHTPGYLVMRDTLTEEVIRIKLLEELDVIENAFLFAFVVPFGKEWILFPTVFDSEGQEGAKEESFLIAEYEQSGYDAPVEFLMDEFLELMNALPYATAGYSPEDFKWKRDAHKEVAVLFEEKMKEIDAPGPVIASGIILWYKYCESEPKLIKKRETYAAALHYINLTVNPLIDVTKKEIASQYGISPSTLGTAIKDMEYDLQQEIKELKGLYLEQIIEDLEAEGIGLPFDFEDELEDDGK